MDTILSNDEPMKKTPDVASTEATAPGTVSRAATFIEWFRRGLMVFTAVAFLYVAYGYYQLFQEGRRVPQPADSTSIAAFELMPLAGALPLDGPWTFAELDWNLRSSVIPSDQVVARMKSMAEPPHQDATRFPDVSDDLLHLIDSLKLVPVEHGGCECYSIDRANLKAQLLVRNVKGHTKAISFVGAYPQDGNRWQVFELTPRAAAGKTAEVVAHLLPLPTGAQRQGGRFADDGRLLLELVSVEATSDSLVAAWKAAGWEVRPSGFGNGAGFSYLCRRSDDVIYAWSANPPKKLQNIMLVYSPTTVERRDQWLVPND